MLAQEQITELTAKQSLALPFIVDAVTVTEGARQVVARKIANEHVFWHKWWIANHPFRVLAEKLRAEKIAYAVDEVRERAKRDLIAQYENLQRVASEGGAPGQVQAIKALMVLAGCKELGASNINVVATATTVDYADRVTKALAGRGLGRELVGVTGNN